MTEQHALWTEPSLLDRFPVGTRVKSLWTDNYGTVVGHDSDCLRLSIRWERWLPREPQGFECWHSSDSGLARLP